MKDVSKILTGTVLAALVATSFSITPAFATKWAKCENPSDLYMTDVESGVSKLGQAADVCCTDVKKLPLGKKECKTEANSYMPPFCGRDASGAVVPVVIVPKGRDKCPE